MSGPKNGKRAVIRLTLCKHPHVLLGSRTRIISSSVPPEEWKRLYPDYLDLDEESEIYGWRNVRDKFQSYVEGKSCPRCQMSGNIFFDWLMLGYNEMPRF